MVEGSDASEASPNVAEGWHGWRLCEGLNLLRPFQGELKEVEIIPLANLLDHVYNCECSCCVTLLNEYFVVNAYPGNKDTYNVPPLQIQQASVWSVSNQSNMELEKEFWYPRNQYYVLELVHVAEAGIYTLNYKFAGLLDQQDLYGFYRSSYQTSSGEKRYMATAKFWSDAANRAFPCFDEPRFKTTFNISLVHRKSELALSNMPVLGTEPIDTDKYITRFMETVPMTTYLTCFIVCDYEYKELITSSGTPIRAYIWPDAINTTTFALQSAYGMLEYFEQYFGINYSLPKLDLIVIPQFRSGASENWGLVTFSKFTLPYDPIESTSKSKQAVAAIVSHELSHMWFGNLVTMEEWKDAWLNEGFASYFEYFGVEAQYPDWDIHSYFLIEDFYPIMMRDMGDGPISPVVPPASLTHTQKISSNIGGSFTYKKGASIIRMIEYVLGREKFRNAITNYLKSHEYKNTVTDDLLDELSAVGGPQGHQSISHIMKTWLHQVGFPYVTITRKSSDTFIAKQRRFAKSEEIEEKKEEAEEQKSVWSIPLSYKSSDGQEGIVWLHDKEETEFSLPVKDSDWLKFNVNQTGYYIVNYDKDDWKKLSDALLKNHQAMSASDRSNLLFDSYLLAEAGHLSIDAFFSLSRYMKNEKHPVPWTTFQSNYKKILKIIHKETDLIILFKDYIRYLTSELYENLGWNTSKNHIDNLLRPVIIDLACSSGNQQCLVEASQLFKKWIEGERLPVDAKNLVFKYGMVYSNDLEEWNFMWDKCYAEMAFSNDCDKPHLEGLTNVPEPSLIQRFISKGVFIGTTIFSNLLENPVAQQQTWNYLNNVGNVDYKFLRGEYMSSEEDFKQMIKDDNITNYDHLLKHIRVQQRWLENNLQSLKTWLSTESSVPWYHYRLPEYQVPLHYDLQLHPILEKDLFIGTVAIDVQLLRPSGCLVLHSLDLRLSRVSVKDNAGQELEIEKFFLHQENDYVVIMTRDKMAAGLYRLYIEFEGDLKMNLKGLYKSSYVDPETNEKRFLATTQFESIDARRAFPCFDEPNFKTTFNVSIIHDHRHFALSNAIEESTTENENGFLVTKFEKTPPMVTYLLAIVVCDFEYKETITENGVRLRTYAAPYLIEKAQYALDTGSKILTYYETYFDIPFPLKKLDMIAIPDFAANGMENWGLVTYRERSFLCSNESTLEAKKPIVGVIAHELAHMWFGDLVTMQWWSDLWLNEGFATRMSYVGVKFAEPEMAKEDKDADAIVNAMSSDKTMNSHPIVQPVTRVNSAIFDGITYGKGGAVLKMLENFMGEDFRIGVSAYLKKYAFGNAETENLWDSLTEASKEGLNVSSLMRTWTHQMNYPYIMVERIQGGANETTYSLQQHQDFESRRHREMAVYQSSDQYYWQIPVTYRSSHSSEVQRMVLNTTEKVNLTVPDSDWVKLNYGCRGFYSVNYDTQTWKKFIDILEKNHTFFSLSDRLNLIYDALSLSESGVLDFDVSLNLTRYLIHEEHPSPWSLGLNFLLGLKNSFSDDRQYIVEEFIRSISKDLYNKYAWNDTTDNDERSLRGTLIAAACGSGNRECLQTAGRLFKQWMDEGQELPSDLKSYVFFYGLKVHSDTDTWNYMWNLYLNETDPYEQQQLLSNLPAVPNQDILGKLLEYAKDEELVRKHDFFSVLRSISGNKKGGGKDLVFRFIDDNWDYIVGKYDAYETERFISGMFSDYKTEADLEKVRKFYKRHPKAKGTSKLRSDAISEIEYEINWSKERRDEVEKWFKKNVHMPWNNLRLPTNVTPVSYNITLHPNITQGDFNGDVSIHLTVSQPSDTIVFHQSGLEITDLKLLLLDNDNVVDIGEENVDSRSKVEIDEEFPYKRNELHVVRLKEKIQGGRYVLEMKFAGKLAKEGRGMRRYQYTDRVTNEKRYLLATMFEPTYARKVFPCFDEPAFKAKFRLSIVHQSNMTALFNMPESGKNSLGDGLVKTVFQESPVMSTYLLFAAVSDFKYLEANYKGKPVRVYAPSDRIQEAKYGLNLTVHIMEKLENYFGVPYSLPKLDSIVVPGYMIGGMLGMEHWGAIAYTGESFLIEDQDSIVTKAMEWNRVSRIDPIVVHELVHQWIGNLVTMKWWDDLWLKEGLTSLVMYQRINDYVPEIEEVDARKRSQMMCADSIARSHPIVRNVSTSEDIKLTFDALAYRKGSAVFMMLQHILKTDFQKGISAYLNKYAYKNADEKDLWTELTNATSLDLDVAKIMDTWTQQIGFPFVEVHIRGGTVQASQEWFVRDKDPIAALQTARKLHYAPYGLIWKIPLVYRNLRTREEHTLWLENKMETFQINATSEDVIKFNPDFVGFYIVKYDSFEYAKLGRKLRQNHLDLSVSDRYNLLHDSFLLAESDRLTYDIPLRLSRYLERETRALPWTMFRDGTRLLMRRLGPQSRQLLKAFIADVTFLAYENNIAAIQNKNYFRFWKTTNEECAYNNPTPDFLFVVVELACRASNAKCDATMSQELQQWMLGKESKVDLPLLFELAIPKYGNATLWDFLHGELVSSDRTEDEKRLMAKGLALFTDPQLIQKTIAAISQDPQIEPNLAQVLFKGLSENFEAAPLLWEYAKGNWSHLMNRLAAKSDPSIGISTFCEMFSTPDQLHEIEEFMKTIPEAKSISEKCLSEIQDKINWSKKNEEDIAMWLNWNIRR
ncbi:hypothetical protein JTE90_005356 [Oedothorax gibbosus]|uniref:glutamyl aminopeptidase n=1 Tax=Oedothorax gibbosus TaxID=931172 RepID=A0AAV6UKJ6_9ARAC|nr:hypothetical protein JTE90_005356 [Oedothorax gibbosus]